MHRLLLVTALAAIAAGAPAAPQGNPAPPTESHIGELEKRLAASGGNYLSFLDSGTMQCGLYRLMKGEVDEQLPHRLDEIYYVVAGRAALDVAGSRHEASPGSVLFVPAGAAHRFVDIEEDLETLVIFSNAVPESGGMAAGPKPSEQTPYPETSSRGSTRIFYWFGPGSAGQVEIDYGRAAWQAAYESFLGKPDGTRWRFGQNFWTRLDTNMDLEIGGTRLPAGYYYLVLENSRADGVRLIALDPTEIRKARLDAYQAPASHGGIAIPLDRSTTENPSGRLSIALEVDRSKRNRGTLEIVFGPHRMHAGIEMFPAR